MADLPAGRAEKTISEIPTVSPNATVNRGISPAKELSQGRQENKSVSEHMDATADGAMVR